MCVPRSAKVMPDPVTTITLFVFALLLIWAFLAKSDSTLQPNVRAMDS